MLALTLRLLVKQSSMETREYITGERYVPQTPPGANPANGEGWSTQKKILVAGASVVAAGALVALLKSPAQKPKKANAVSPFDVEKYLGKWYEIARMDYKYEQGLSHVTAEYSLKSNCNLKVVNRGYNELKDEWEEATGKAKFANDPEVGQLRVSFFGPFYSGYNVIAVDPDYEYALVAGESLDFLWILSRTTDIPEEVKQHFLEKAKLIGYKPEELVWTNHD